jgi:alkylation response protein AidB-like acyl-CoA dehydrogenase
MNFFFTSEQQMLAASIHQCFERLPKVVYEQATPEEERVSQDLKSFAATFGELGILGIIASEDAGGLGMGFSDAILVAIEAGRFCVSFPMIETIVAAYYMARIRPEDASEVIEGRCIATTAISGNLHATRQNDVIMLQGSILAPYANHAEWIAAPATNSEDEKLVVLLKNPSDIIDIQPSPRFDLTSPTYKVQIDCKIDPAMVIPANSNSILALLGSADMLGTAEAVNQRTVQYLKDRVQFGEPIGKNQSLKHIAADDHVCLENMRVATEYAAAVLDQFRDDVKAGKPRDHSDIDMAVAVAKSYSSRAARQIARDATQLHGGMGFTWELGLHVPVRRMIRMSTVYGNSEEHSERIAQLLIRGNSPW